MSERLDPKYTIANDLLYELKFLYPRVQPKLTKAVIAESYNALQEKDKRIEELNQRNKELEQALLVLIDDVPKLVKKAYFEPTDREFSDFERSNLNIECNYLLKQAKAVSDG